MASYSGDDKGESDLEGLKKNHEEDACVAKDAVQKEVVDVNDLDPDEVFKNDDDDDYKESEMARMDMIDTNKIGFRGWKYVDYNEEEDYYFRLDENGEEVEYNGSADTDSNFDPYASESSSGDEVSSSHCKRSKKI